MDYCHEPTNHGARIGMLVDIASVNHAHCALPHQRRRFVEYRTQIFLAAASHKDRTARGLNDPVDIIR
jgi:hypothetical protein